ncbi:hypothetical protein [Georgenia yuyongxinii]
MPGYLTRAGVRPEEGDVLVLLTNDHLTTTPGRVDQLIRPVLAAW